MTVIEAARPSPGKRANDLPAQDQSKPSRATTGRATTHHPTAGRATTGRATTHHPTAGRATTGRSAAPVPHRPPAPLRRGQLVALAVGAFLLPWCVLLGLTLPATADAQHWSLAWAGLDCAEAVAALATALLLRRADPRAGLTAVAGGALLLADAWFDVCTSAPGLDHALAVAEACCLELPLAGAAFWLALRLTPQHLNSL
jgi:LPXTG-motif cell wall-anchored protein